MSLSQSSRNPVANKLLEAIPRGEYERLLPHLEFVSLPIKQVLHEANEPIEYAYFPLTAVASILNLMSDGEAIEAATVGNEAMVGVSLLLGASLIFCIDWASRGNTAQTHLENFAPTSTQAENQKQC